MPTNHQPRNLYILQSTPNSAVCVGAGTYITRTLSPREGMRLGDRLHGLCGAETTVCAVEGR
jgi:hypothetical protein